MRPGPHPSGGINPAGIFVTVLALFLGLAALHPLMKGNAALVKEMSGLLGVAIITLIAAVVLLFPALMRVRP